MLTDDSFVYYSQSCQADLIKDSGQKYFLSVLADQSMTVSTVIVTTIVTNQIPVTPGHCWATPTDASNVMVTHRLFPTIHDTVTA